MNIDTKKIRTLLAQREMTNKQLAESCGVARQNIGAVLKRGTCEPRTAGRIAKALDVDVVEILVFDE